MDAKTILITGATGGIGHKTAHLLAEQGYSLFLQARNADKLNQLKQILIEQYSIHVEVCVSDINQVEQVKQVFQQFKLAQKNNGLNPLYGLVHCAGDMLEAPLMMTKPEQILQQFNIHTSSALLLAQYASRLMTAQRQGCLVFIGSIVAHQGATGQSVYAGVKSALFGICKSLAKELGGQNIRVNTVSPGFIETDLNQHYSPEQKAHIATQASLKRLGKAEDVAGAIAFLLSEHAQYITAQDIQVDGGLNLG